MKRLAIIGGIGMMTMAGTNMIWHKQKPNFNAKHTCDSKRRFYSVNRYNY